VARHLRAAAKPRVLVIFPGALGDLVCLVPTLCALDRRHRGASLELMARAELADLAVGRMRIARGHSIDRPEVSRLFAVQADADKETEEFFGNFARVYSFFAADDAGYRSALARACGKAATFHPFRPVSGGHVAAGYLQAVGEAYPLNARIELLADDLEAAARTLDEHRLESGKFTLFLPGSGNPDKNWPAEHFAALANLIDTRIQIAVVLGPAEAGMEGFFLERGLPVLKDLTLGQLAAIERQALTFVGNDSGASHLGAAAGAAGVVLFGPTDPARWRPLSGRIKVLWRDPFHSLEPGEVSRALAELRA
jgi:ADP-heptose:LPS heptosyltransferase